MGVLQLHHHATVTPLVLTEHHEGYLDTPQCSGNTKVLHHGVFNSACQIIGCSGSTNMLVQHLQCYCNIECFQLLTFNTSSNICEQRIMVMREFIIEVTIKMFIFLSITI